MTRSGYLDRTTINNHHMDPPRTPLRNPPLANHEVTTRQKAKFFEAVDSRAPD